MWLPTKLEKQLAFAAEAGTPLTFTSYYKVDALYLGEAADFVPNGRVVWAPERVDYSAMLVQDHIGVLTAMYDRRVVGVKLMPDMPKRQDYALWLSIMRDGTPARACGNPRPNFPDREGHLSSRQRQGRRPSACFPFMPLSRHARAAALARAGTYRGVVLRSRGTRFLPALMVVRLPGGPDQPRMGTDTRTFRHSPRGDFSQPRMRC